MWTKQGLSTQPLLVVRCCWQGWRGVQYFFGGAMSVFTTQSLLGALGVAGRHKVRATRPAAMLLGCCFLVHAKQRLTAAFECNQAITKARAYLKHPMLDLLCHKLLHLDTGHMAALGRARGVH